jgi:hypothetical protein
MEELCQLFSACYSETTYNIQNASTAMSDGGLRDEATPGHSTENQAAQHEEPTQKLAAMSEAQTNNSTSLENLPLGNMSQISVAERKTLSAPENAEPPQQRAQDSQGNDALTISKEALDDNAWRRSSPKVTFMTLPLEIREMIYTYAMQDLPKRLAVPSKQRIRKFTLSANVLPNVCFVSKTIWMEACVAYIRRTQFVLDAYDRPWLEGGISPWLKQFPNNQGIKSVQMLACTHAYFRMSELFFTVLMRWNISAFSGLRSASISVRHIDVLSGDYTPTGGKPYLPSLDESREKLTFPGLFQLTKLRYLKVICKGCQHCVKMLGLASHKCLFAAYLTLLHEGFARRGGAIDIEVEYLEY